MRFHSTKLVDNEIPFVFPDSLLNEKHGARIVNYHSKNENYKKRGKDDEAKKRQQQIKTALQNALIKRSSAYKPSIRYFFKVPSHAVSIFWFIVILNKLNSFPFKRVLLGWRVFIYILIGFFMIAKTDMQIINAINIKRNVCTIPSILSFLYYANTCLLLNHSASWKITHGFNYNFISYHSVHRDMTASPDSAPVVSYLFIR